MVAGAIRWNYDRAELIADGIVHGLGVFLGLIALTVLIVLTAVFASATEIVTVSVYAAGLLAMLGFSAAYNMWPVSPQKWFLRRFDHSAIYLLIAATYTPFLAQISNGWLAAGLLAFVWGVAITGIVMKLLYPGRFDGLAVVLYLALGWSGMMAYNSCSRRCRRSPCGSSLPAARFTRRASSFTLGAACASRMPSGTHLSCVVPRATIRRCSIW